MLSPVSYLAGGGAGAVEGGLTETLVWRSLHSNKHWRGGDAADTAVKLDRDGDGPVLLSDLGVRGWWRPLRHKYCRSIAQPHRILDLHNGPLSVENWRCLETQAYYQYCMTSKNLLVLIKFLSMTTLFALLNHSVLVCLIP
jgi:hypothetical protein